MSLKLRIVLIFASVVCYLVACTFPALHLQGKQNTLGERDTMAGAAAFFCGFFGVFMGQLAWLANPLSLIAIILVLCRRFNAALLFAVIALLVAQHARAVVGTIIDGDEGGVKKYLVTSLGLGYYLWLLAFALVAAASLVREPRVAGADGTGAAATPQSAPHFSPHAVYPPTSPYNSPA